MLTTSRLGISYPNPDRSDAPDIPAHFLNLATILDTAAVDSQGSLGSRPTSTGGTPGVTGRYYYATDTGQVFRDYGTGWAEIARPPTFVTSLPGSPYDGQEIHYSANAGSAIWHLRYRSAASGSYKWEYVGGSCLWNDNSSGSNVYTTGYFDSAAGSDPTITVPIAGDYQVAYGAVVTTPGSYNVGTGIKVGAASVQASDAVVVIPGPDTMTTVVEGRFRKAAVAASTAMLMQHKITTSGAGYVVNRWLEVTPVRVG